MASTLPPDARTATRGQTASAISWFSGVTSLPPDHPEAIPARVRQLAVQEHAQELVRGVRAPGATGFPVANRPRAHAHQRAHLGATQSAESTGLADLG